MVRTKNYILCNSEKTICLNKCKIKGDSRGAFRYSEYIVLSLVLLLEGSPISIS